MSNKMPKRVQFGITAHCLSFLETLRNYFSQYGEVVDCVIMKDKSTNQSRGFGFVKFKDPNCVRTVLDTKPHNLDGRNVRTNHLNAFLIMCLDFSQTSMFIYCTFFCFLLQ